MAKPNFNYIRKLINNKMSNLPITNTSASHSACHKESNKLFAAAVKKASKETLTKIVLGHGSGAHTVLKVPTSYDLREQRLKELHAPYIELLSQLDSLELKAAMGSDPSEELKKIVAAIEKL